jgi:alpha-galactosidase
MALATLSGLACSLARAGQPLPDDLVEAQRWFNARFGESAEAQPLTQGLTVLANYGAVQKCGRGDRDLCIHETRYTRGFYCHAASQFLVRTNRPVRALIATIGVDSNPQTRPGRGSIVFVVSAGDREIYRSETLHEGMPGVPIRVELQGSREFTMQVEDATDGISCDQADWADAKLEFEKGDEMWLDELPMLDLNAPPPGSEAPFSFVLGGRASATFLNRWKLERQMRAIDAHRTQHTLTYADPESKMVVRCEAVAYDDFPVVEWTVYLRNEGTGDSPLIENLQALDMTVQRPVGNEFVLHHLRGDLCTPDSYEPFATVLEPNVNQRFAPGGGRSTNGAWPYWNVQWGSQGILLALGWPGQWAAEFARDAGELLHVTGGQELTHFVLHPGEEVRTPLVAMQFYRGTPVRAQNVWRSWMLTHNLPRNKDNVLPPILSSCSGGFFPGLKCNEVDEKRFLDTYAQHGVRWDYWWMDAGWYPCSEWPYVGTWEVDATRFPRGIKAVSDHAKTLGSQLILWFEPERVTAGSWLSESHPEWLLDVGNGTMLLNLGNQVAREWLIEHVDAFIKREGVGLYRQDFNMDPLAYWRAADAPDRQGLTEIGHVTGYLAYWDALRRRNPGMLIDSCASGGRRNDLETLRRAIPLLRSDYQSFAGDPSFALGNQCHTYGLSSWLPFYGQGCYYNADELVYNVRSHYCPAFGFCADVRREGIDWDQFRKLTEEWRTVSQSLLGDFYPLTPYTLAEDVWIAWQFHRPDTGEGVVQVFRRPKSFYSAAQFKLQGLDPLTTYTLTIDDSPTAFTKTGRELAEEGIEISTKRQPAAVIVHYHKCEYLEGSAK